MVSLKFYLYILLPFIFLVALAPGMSGQCNVETTVATTDNFCANQDSIYISLFPSGGTEPYSYLWSNSASTQTTSVLLTPSDIYFTITDANGCVNINFVHIKAGPYVASIGGNYFLCGSQQATLNLFWYRFPPEDVTYLWSNGATTPTIDISTAGPYSVTVTDPSNGCSLVFSTSVDPPSPSLEINNITGASCGQNTGAIDINVTGEYTPFTYLWSNGSTTEDLNNLTSGNYTVTVTSSDGCTATVTATVSGNGNLSITGVTNPNTSCINNNGSVNITPTPPGTYTYAWSNGATNEDIAIVSAGNYTVTVTAAGGCSSTASFTVDNNQNIPGATATIIPASCNQSNGSINLTVSGGVAPFTYTWSNGMTTEDLTNVPAGSYTITVTSNNGCTTTATFAVQNSGSTIAITGNTAPNTSCINTNGSANIAVSPSGTYTYEWSNGATTEDLSGLSPGTYFLTVTGTGGCTGTASFTVANNPIDPEVTSTASPASCGQNNGTINLNVTGGISPFSFIWSEGQTTEDINNLQAGTYTVTVTGDNGCSSVTTINIPNSNSTITISGTSTSNTSCLSANGSVNLTINPAGSYLFQWSNGSTNEDLTGLNEGEYYVTVTDVGGCSSTANFTITNNQINPTGTISITPSTCGDQNGNIDLAVTSGASQYSFLWSNGATTEDVTSVSAGIYNVTITDDNGCTGTYSVNVTNSDSNMDITGILTPNTSCSVDNGEINITVNPSDIYAYNWSNGSTLEDISNLSEGTYSVTITNVDGCIVTTSFIIEDNTPVILISGTSGNNISCLIPNGNVDLTVLPTDQYSFTWSNGAMTEDLQNVAEGTYDVIVTGINGCSATASFTVISTTSAPVFSSMLTNETCGESNGAIDLNVAAADNLFSWSTGSASEDLKDLNAGIYFITITNSNGCSSIDSFEIENISTAFTISATVTEDTSCIISSGAINLEILPAGTYSYIWSAGQTSEDLQLLSSGTYTVTVTDQMGCQSSETFVIQNNMTDLEINLISFPATCGQSNGSIDLTIMPSGGNLISWSNGANTEDLENISPGSYSVTITNSNGCSANADIIVENQNNSFSIDGTSNNNHSCITPNGSITVNVTPNGSYEYAWSNGLITSSLQNLSAGIYVLTVTDQIGCSSSQSFVLIDSTFTPKFAANIIPSSCNLNNGAIDVIVIGPSNNTFLWSNGYSGEDLIDVASGIYSVTVTNENGCSKISNFTLPDQSSNFEVWGIAKDDESC
ncbi:MAG TPA: VCBS domain-containing protein, partial [Saprospiraceae bacterium]|nr:VCBS domain-containing protein [Saprospiraceae bacterium]